MMKKSKDDVRGVSNSPLTDTIDDFDLSTHRGKEVKFDWFQVTFDFIPVHYVEGKNIYSLEKHHPLFKMLMKLLGRKEDVDDFEQMKSDMWGFRNGLQIDEFIWYLYGGKKTKHETWPSQLIISGQGCRVFEQMGGNWRDLFSFFLRHQTTHLKIGNLHLAIDDYEGNEVTPYMLEPYFKNKWLVTPFRTADLIHRIDYTGEPSNLGYSWTFGKRGANQLHIYDKALERRSNNYYVTIDKWYRYEMRFVDDKAKQVIDLYVQSVDENNSEMFMKFAKKLLLSIMDVKQPSQSDTNKSRWETLPEWAMFTDSLEKINLNTKNRTETTIAKKIPWFKEDMATTMLELFIVFGPDFFEELYEILANSKFKLKHLNRINNYLRDKGKTELTIDDIRSLQASLKKNDSEAVVTKATAKK